MESPIAQCHHHYCCLEMFPLYSLPLKTLLKDIICQVGMLHHRAIAENMIVDNDVTMPRLLF